MNTGRKFICVSLIISLYPYFLTYSHAGCGLSKPKQQNKEAPIQNELSSEARGHVPSPAGAAERQSEAASAAAAEQRPLRSQAISLGHQSPASLPVQAGAPGGPPIDFEEKEIELDQNAFANRVGGSQHHRQRTSPSAAAAPICDTEQNKIKDIVGENNYDIAAQQVELKQYELLKLKREHFDNLALERVATSGQVSHFKKMMKSIAGNIRQSDPKKLWHTFDESGIFFSVKQARELWAILAPATNAYYEDGYNFTHAIYSRAIDSWNLNMGVDPGFVICYYNMDLKLPRSDEELLKFQGKCSPYEF